MPAFYEMMCAYDRSPSLLCSQEDGSTSSSFSSHSGTRAFSEESGMTWQIILGLLQKMLVDVSLSVVKSDVIV